MATFANQSKTAISPTNQEKGTSGEVTATAGLYYGFGAFTYSGGETLTPGTLPVFTNQSKN